MNKPSISGSACTPAAIEVPAHLSGELALLRRRFAPVLAAAARGEYRQARALQILSRHLGRVLAREARRPAEQRGISMLQLSLAVDRLFPELQSIPLLHAESLLARRLTGRRTG